MTLVAARAHSVPENSKRLLLVRAAENCAPAAKRALLGRFRPRPLSAAHAGMPSPASWTSRPRRCVVPSWSHEPRNPCTEPPSRAGSTRRQTACGCRVASGVSSARRRPSRALEHTAARAIRRIGATPRKMPARGATDGLSLEALSPLVYTIVVACRRRSKCRRWESNSGNESALTQFDACNQLSGKLS